VVTTLDEDTVAIVDVLTAASLVVGFVDGTEVTFGVVIVAALVVGFVDGSIFFFISRISMIIAHRYRSVIIY
jgi:hypothetical protein